MNKLLPVFTLLIGLGLGVAATWKLGVEPARREAAGNPSKLQEAENRANDLLAQAQEWERKAQEWETRFKNLGPELQGKLDNATAEAERLRGELTTQAAALQQQFQGQIDSAKGEAAQLKQQLGSLSTEGQAKLEALQKNLDQQIATLASKDQAIAAKDKFLAEAQASSAKLEKKIDDLNKEVKRLNDTLLLMGGKKP